MEIAYCWRVETFLPMLAEDEWAEISPLLTNTIQKIKDYRAIHGCDIPTAREKCSPETVAKFEQLTGHKNIGYDLIFYLRRKDYGPTCSNCSKLFRTPKAKLCVECGHRLENNA